MLLPNAVDNAPCELVRAVGSEVGIILQFRGLARKGVRREVDEGVQRTLRAHHFEERFAHRIQIDQPDLLLCRHISRCLGILA